MGVMSDPIVSGSVASLVAGMATGVGGACVYAIRKLSARTEDMLLSGAAGVMLAATFFSLIVPAIERSDAFGRGHVVSVAIVIAGIVAGAVTLWAIHAYTPHEHLGFKREGPDAPRVSRVLLFVFAIALHNFPEGLAVGVAVAGTSIHDGMPVAIGIGLQNVPEGLAVATSLLGLGVSRTRSFLAALLTGFIEPLGGVVSSVAVTFAAPMLPLTLAFSAGAMLFIISDEIIPETHRRGYETQATFSLIGGFALMMLLDAAFA